MHTGPYIKRDGLVFGYDTGYPIVSGSSDTYRFNLGEPTENYIPNVGTSVANWSEYGWSGDFVTSSDFLNTFELTSTNGWHNATFDHGVSSGIINISFEYKLKSQQTSGIYGFVLNGTHLGSYTNYIKALNNADVPTFQWKTFSEAYTGNADTKIAIGLRGTDSAGLSDTMYIKNLQVEVKGHKTPFTTGTRSVSGSLLDLKGNTDIDLSNVSFDSNAQMTFDGTDDRITIPAGSFNTIGTNDFTVEIIAKNTKTSSYNHFFSVKDQYHFALKMQNATNTDRNIYVYRTSGLSTFSAITARATSTTLYYHIVCKREGDNIEIFLNGVSGGTKSGWGSISIDNNTWPSYIGWGVGSEYTGGNIPVVKLYNRALTAAEVLQNFKAYKNRFGI